MNLDRVLHVLGQSGPHDDVRIIGDEHAIKALADACYAALQRIDPREPSSVMTPTVFVNDGEGFHVQVVCVRDRTMLGRIQAKDAMEGRR